MAELAEARAVIGGAAGDGALRVPPPNTYVASSRSTQCRWPDPVDDGLARQTRIAQAESRKILGIP